MFTVSRLLLLVVLGTLSVGALEESCPQLQSGSAEAAMNYLAQAPDEPAAVPCVQLAFHQIASLPPKRAIPLLINYLGYKRPLDEGERHGFFLHAPTPDLLYPAVRELSLFGSAAEGPLIQFIGEGPKASGVALDHALYTLLLVHQGDVVTVIKTLHHESSTSTKKAARDRLEAAAKMLLNRWCLDEQTRAACEKALQ